MSTILTVVAGILFAAAFVFAFYTGKAELSVGRMFAQYEVVLCFWGSYICSNISDLLEGNSSYGEIFIKILFYICTWGFLMPLVHSIGVRRKQKQREQ